MNPGLLARPPVGRGAGTRRTGIHKELTMKLTTHLYCWNRTSGHITRHQEHSTLDPHSHDIDGIDTVPLAIEQASCELDRRLVRLGPLGGFWFIMLNNTLVAHSCGYRHVPTTTEGLCS